MRTGWLLWRLAKLACDRTTSETVIEPLLADWQREIAAARTPAERRAIWRHGVGAFWTTFLRCTGRALLVAPTRITLGGAIVAVYGLGTAFVVVYGITWVQTGRIELDILRLRWVLGLAVGPIALSWLGPRLASTLRSRTGLYAFLSAMQILNFAILPEHQLRSVVMLGVYTALLLWQSTVRSRAMKRRP